MTISQGDRERVMRMLRDAGLTVANDEEVEVTDFGLGDFAHEGLSLLTYVNTPRYCAKELVLLPGQTCPQHRHPPFGGGPGKEETFRCRGGRVHLYVSGEPTPEPACRPPAASEASYTVWHEVALEPGDQYTIPPDTWHWFQAGPEGALVTEFSSMSRDDLDVFLDPRVVRVPASDGANGAGAAVERSAPTGDPAEPSGEPILMASGLSKAYGRTYALSDVSLALHPGEIVALVGDNGAGKSTLVKSLAGVIAPNEGEIVWDGARRRFASPLDARLAGLETVHQDLALCDNLTAYQNVFLGRELKRDGVRLLARRRMRERARAIMAERLGIDGFPVERRTAELSGGQRQLVALARADAWDARVLLLDEPTAALSAEATGRVVEVIRRLRSRGVAILIISHDIPQVMEVTDRIVVLRQGRVAATVRTGDANAEQVLGLMTGAIRSPNDV